MINDLTDEVFRVKSPDVGISTGDLKKTLEQLRSVYSTQRGIEQLVFSELLRMHFPFGKRYKRGEIYKYTEQIPIMVNSEPATGNGIIFIRKARLDKQRCELVQQMIIHPDSAEKMLTKYFHSMGMNPQAIPGTVNNSTLEVNEENIYDYYYFPGIPVKLSATRETRINVMDDRIRHTEMTLIEQIQP